MGLEEHRVDGAAQGCLELRRDHEGINYFLDGRLLQSGVVVEILLHKGQWLRGIFEWDQDEIRWPGVRVPLGGPWEQRDGYRPSLVAPIHPQAILRWPSED